MLYAGYPYECSLVFLRVSSQCDIPLRILPGWYGYIQYTLSSLDCTLGETGIYICVCIYIYIIFVYCV